MKLKNRNGFVVYENEKAKSIEHLVYLAVKDDMIIKEVNFDDCSFGKYDFHIAENGLTKRKAMFENCIFKNCTFRKPLGRKPDMRFTKFLNCTFEKSSFKNLELINVDFFKSTFPGSFFHDCNLSMTWLQL